MGEPMEAPCMCSQCEEIFDWFDMYSPATARGDWADEYRDSPEAWFCSYCFHDLEAGE